MTLVDTAEMYGSGGAEEVVGDAIRGQREEVFVVSKFYPAPRFAPQAAARPATLRGRASGSRRIDLYLYHWRGNVPLAETVDALDELVAAGKHRALGRFQLRCRRPRGAGARSPAASTSRRTRCSTTSRGAAPSSTCCRWCAQRGIATMAYSPLDEGRLLRHRGVAALARALGVSPAQLALAWLARHADVIAIPKAVRPSTCARTARAADLGSMRRRSRSSTRSSRRRGAKRRSR